MSRQVVYALCALLFAGFLLFMSLWRLTLLPSERDDRAYLSHISVQERIHQLVTPPFLPDHPLYIAKVLSNRIELWFTPPTRQLFTLTALADDRLTSAALLLQRGRKGLAVSTATKAEKYLLLASQQYRYVAPSEKTKAQQRIDQAIEHHVTVLTTMKSQVSDAQRASIDALIMQLKQVQHTTASQPK